MCLTSCCVSLYLCVCALVCSICLCLCFFKKLEHYCNAKHRFVFLAVGCIAHTHAFSTSIYSKFFCAVQCSCVEMICHLYKIFNTSWVGVFTFALYFGGLCAFLLLASIPTLCCSVSSRHSNLPLIQSNELDHIFWLFTHFRSESNSHIRCSHTTQSCCIFRRNDFLFREHTTFHFVFRVN